MILKRLFDLTCSRLASLLLAMPMLLTTILVIAQLPRSYPHNKLAS